MANSGHVTEHGAGLCAGRREHPLSADFYICCDLAEGHEGPHLGAKDRTVEWTDESKYALPAGWPDATS